MKTMVSKDGKTLTIEVDLTQQAHPSKTGKTLIIESSHGNQPVATPDGKTVFVGLNVYKNK